MDTQNTHAQHITQKTTQYPPQMIWLIYQLFVGEDILNKNNE